MVPFWMVVAAWQENKASFIRNPAVLTLVKSKTSTLQMNRHLGYQREATLSRGAIA
jgi:hypothetical protein